MGFTHEAVNRHVEDEDVTKCYTPTTSGEQLMTSINENGLYVFRFSIQIKIINRLCLSLN